MKNHRFAPFGALSGLCLIVTVLLIFTVAATAWIRVDAASLPGGVGEQVRRTLEQAGAQAPLHPELEFVHQIGGSTDDVAVRDQLAYIGLGPRLVILDVSDPANPQQLGESEVLPYTVQRVAVAGDLAFAATPRGLCVIHIADPAHPLYIGTFWEILGEDCALAAAGDHVYLANGYSNLQVLDVSDPVCPVEIATFDTPERVCSLSLQGSYVYVIDSYHGLYVLDASDPEHLSHLGSYALDYATSLTVDGDYAYVGGDGLSVINVSDPHQPTLHGFCDIFGTIESIAAEGGLVYLVQCKYCPGRLTVVDASDPTAPTVVGFLDTPGPMWNVIVEQRTAYIAAHSSGLYIVSASEASAPRVAGSYAVLPMLSAGVAHHQYAYFCSGNGIGILDISFPAHARQIGSCTLPSWAFSIALDPAAAHAYVSAYDAGLRIVDMSIPSAPYEIGRLDTRPGVAMGVALAGHYAYVGNYTEGLRIVDISDPKRPVEVGSLATPAVAMNIAVQGSLAYVTTGGAGLRVVDISDPRHPIEVGVYEPEAAIQDVAVAGHYAYLTDYFAGLDIVDISDPAHPQRVGRYALGTGANGLAVCGNHAYVANGFAGLAVIDVSDPASPVWTGGYYTPGIAHDVVVHEGLICLSCGEEGLFILRLNGVEPAPTHTPTPPLPTRPATATPTQTPLPTATPTRGPSPVVPTPLGKATPEDRPYRPNPRPPVRPTVEHVVRFDAGAGTQSTTDTLLHVKKPYLPLVLKTGY